jgi:Domain of unknown function (DUF4349)
MSTFSELRNDHTKTWALIAAGFGIGFLWLVMALPTLHRSGRNLSMAQQVVGGEQSGNLYTAAPAKSKTVVTAEPAAAAATDAVMENAAGARPAPDASGERKIIRSSSLAIVVQHPAQVMDKIMALAEIEGGYLESSQGGGQDAASGSLTIRVPAARFEQTRAEIRKLGLRVENESIDARDVTRQYVDQDANLRNLRAEEAQYLAILKQANTVKDLLAVSQRISEVRGQIEQQQAEFNALSKQTETVAIAISLRTEAETQVFGLNWRPLYQVKLALRDGLESLAGYTSAMMAFLFYLPAVLLWLGTIAGGAAVGWRLLRWVGRRWFGWQKAAVVV